MLSFKGRTALITGATGALGKIYATDLAKRGCNLFLNDMVGTPLDKIATELQGLGVNVETNQDSIIEHGSAVSAACVKHFGKCDILINNAGNLIDKSFAKMTPEDWRGVMDVHLQGTFSLSHSLWQHMLQNQYGRIINIGSGAGLYGNFGQANYSSAKMAILGLTQTLAKEGQKHNVFVNCVVPIAKSKMTETVLPPEVLALLDPAHIAPIVTLLSHESSTHSGECFEVGGGWFSKIRIQRSAGRFIPSATAEALAAQISSVSDFSEDSTFPTSAADGMQALMIAKERLNLTEDVSAEQTNEKSQTQDAVISLPSDTIFQKLQRFIEADADRATSLAGKVRAAIVFEIVNKQGSVQKRWLLSMKKDSMPSITVIRSEADSKTVDCTLVLEDSTVLSLLKKELSPEYAYMRGLLKIRGQMGAAMKVKNLLDVSKDL